MVTGGTVAVAFQWDEVRLPKLLYCSAHTVLLGMLRCMHDPLLPLILKRHTKCLLPALKIYKRLSFMTISASVRTISTGHLQVSFLRSALAALESLWDDQIFHPDVNQHIEVYKQGLSVDVCTAGTDWGNVWAVQNPHLEPLCSRVKCCAVKPAQEVGQSPGLIPGSCPTMQRHAGEILDHPGN